MEKNEVMLSVIIPVYNMEKFLQQCLDSVLNQTIKNFEVICIDDGSTDSSLEILQEYAKSHENIHVVSQKNMGVAMTRNKGMDMAIGEYVVFMDPDDYYPDNNVLKDLHDTAKENNALICGGSFCEIHSEGMKTSFDGIYENTYTFFEDKFIPYTDYQFDYGYHRFIYNRAMLIENNICFPNYIRFQDPPFFVKAMITAKTFFAVKRITYCYRVSDKYLDSSPLKVKAILNGQIDNLVMSNQYNLEKLHCLTLFRLNRFIKNMVLNTDNYKDQEVVELVIKANSLINQEWVKPDETILALLFSRFGEIRKEVSDVYDSETYRIGRAVTYIPRKVKGLLNR